MVSIFIDGRNGTTGLRIVERLSGRKDIELLSLPEERRKDPAARKEILNSCDVALLCLPDAAAIEAVGMIENPSVRVLDASTAHRVARSSRASSARGFFPPAASRCQAATPAASSRWLRRW